MRVAGHVREDQDAATVSTAPSTQVELTDVTVDGAPARVWVGGEGTPLLLVHGGWGGAEIAWGQVLPALARRFRVIAPDLPGLGHAAQPALGSLSAYAAWLARLLDTLGFTGAWCVGNSFGASVACQLAGDFPARVRGLVLVNGIPMPATPALLRRLGERGIGQGLLRFVQRNVAYTPAALARGFVEEAKVPEALRRLVARPEAHVAAFAPLLVQGGSPPPKAFAPLLLWGEGDRLLGTSAADARKLQASWPGSSLLLVPRAGHCPQIEQPEAFAEALVRFVEDRER
jgi:pimeloyl-ACP methyl ester carboxylesterase